jgi:uncharacterized phage protein (TIGR02218 family)
MVTYKGRPVWPFETDWSELPKAGFAYDAREDQIGFGAEVTEPLQQHAVHMFEQMVTLTTPCEVNRFERFVASLQGRRLGFWMSGPLQELDIVSQHDVDEINIVACGLTASWQEQPAKHLWLSNADTGAAVAVKIVAVVDNGDGTERMRLESALAVSPDATWSVSRLYYVRLASDSQEYVYERPWFASVMVQMVELPLETVAAALGDAYVYLYKFTNISGGDTTFYRYTSHDADVTHLGETWTARPFSHGELRSAVQGDSDTLAVQSHMFTGNPLSAYMPFPPERELRVEVREWRVALSVSKVLFAGLVRTVKFDGKSMTAQCETLLADTGRDGPHHRIQTRCQYRLGDAKTCRVNLAALKHTGNMTAISGKSVTVAGLTGATNYWAHGYATCVNSRGQTERRTIVASSGTTVVIQHRWSAFVAVGTSANVYPGCDLTAATCGTKFTNFVNFGGHPKMDRNLTLRAVKLKTTAGGKK